MKLSLVTADLVNPVHQLLCVPEVYEYLADGQLPPISIAQEWVTVADQDNQKFGGGLWALTSSNSIPALCGLVRLSDHRDAQMELTYLLHPDYWHSGLATRMAHTVMGICFRQAIVKTIWAGTDEPNTASLKVMQRLGMLFRNYADYPAGRGLEYEITSGSFIAERITELPVS